MTVTVNLGGLKATKLFVWSLENLALEMHGQGDPNAKRLAEIVARYIHDLALMSQAANGPPITTDPDAYNADVEDFK